MKSPLVLLTALLVGCFSEVGVEPGGSGHTTGDTPCTQGEVGCGCYGNATCDPGLVCETELDRCIPEGCTPGKAACVCAGGQCDAPFECNSGICEVPGADDGVDDGVSTEPVGTSSPAPTSGPLDDTGMSVTDTSSVGDASGSSSGPEPETSDSGDPTCNERSSCATCFGCVDVPGSDCGDEYMACEGVSGCLTVVACLSECGLKGFCFENCCDGLSQAQIGAANELMFCRTDHCTSACSQLEFPTCGN